MNGVVVVAFAVVVVVVAVSVIVVVLVAFVVVFVDVGISSEIWIIDKWKQRGFVVIPYGMRGFAAIL